MIVRGDARQIPLRDESVQCVVTSPPYFQLRDYSCGPREIGNEDTPEEYVAALLDVFREVRRVLRHDGVLWLVLGDASWGTTPRQRALKHPVLKPKDLIGLPWRVALALQADGWYLRADVIWAKPNPMPDPVGDRPSRSHEYVFLFSKSRNYYYDADAIAEPTVSDHPSANRFTRRYDQRHGHRGTSTCWNDIGGRRNRRDVWQIKSDQPKRPTTRRFPPRSPDCACWLARGWAIWSWILSLAPGRLAKCAGGYHDAGPASNCRRHTRCWPASVPHRQACCSKCLPGRVAAVSPPRKPGGAVLCLGCCPEGVPWRVKPL